MKKQTGIWIDGSRAIFVSMTKGEKEVEEIASDIENRVYHDKEGDTGSYMGGQHLSSEKKFNERKIQQQNRFFTRVVEHIRDMDELYILGPAEMKTKLTQKIRGDEPGILIRSVEPAEAMTTNQLVAKVKEFFSRN